jgi:hypothetical protein
MERIGTPDARDVLRSLTTDAPDARLTPKVNVSLERLTKSPH